MHIQTLGAPACLMSDDILSPCRPAPSLQGWPSLTSTYRARRMVQHPEKVRSSMSWSMLARRSFLSQIGTGLSAAAGAATLVAGGATVLAQSAGTGRRQPRRHPQDNWMDEVPGQHRLLLDTTTANG